MHLPAPGAPRPERQAPAVPFGTTVEAADLAERTGDVSSYRRAAQAAGVSAHTLASWVKSGLLPEPPWTLEELAEATSSPESSRLSAAHGTASRWRAGCSCPDCKQAHTVDIRQRHRDLADARFPVEQRTQFLELLARGLGFAEALDALGLTARTVWGSARRDEQWRRHLEETLMATRRTDLKHGSKAAFRAGCRCGDCRKSHH